MKTALHQLELLSILLTLGITRVHNAHAQVAPSSAQHFEVASIRPSSRDERELNGLYTYQSGEVRGKGCTLEYLVMEAFDVQPFQISGGSAWMDLTSGEPFDIDAKPAPSSITPPMPASQKNAPSQEQRQMLQAVLDERFQLKVHRTIKIGPIYVLSRGTGPLRLFPPKDASAYPWAGGRSGGWFSGGIRGENISMAQLAKRLSRFLKKPVLDQTGIAGSFDFDYELGTNENDDDIEGFLLTSMRGIGLALKPGRGQVETIVIDHAEKPAEN